MYLLPFVLAIIHLVEVIKAITCPDGTVISATSSQCCTFIPLLKDLQQNFTGTDTPCTSSARNVLRLAFHDAMGFSSTAEAQGQFGGGGADGSILAFSSIEATYSSNRGFNLTAFILQPFMDRHPGISAGDFLHFAAAMALSTCPGAPRIPFFAGRPAPKGPAPDKTIPEPTDSVSAILDRFADAGGFSPNEVVALMAGHSLGSVYALGASDLRPSFDSTQTLFDTQYYLEVLLSGKINTTSVDPTIVTLSPFEGEVRLLSDFGLARDPRTACTWQGFIDQHVSLQTAFSQAMEKLSLVGQNAAALDDCSAVVPQPPALTPQQSQAVFPRGTAANQIERACVTAPFPNLTTSSIPFAPVPVGACPLWWFSTQCPVGQQPLCCNQVGLPSQSIIPSALTATEGFSSLPSPAEGLVGLGCRNISGIPFIPTSDTPPTSISNGGLPGSTVGSTFSSSPSPSPSIPCPDTYQAVCCPDVRNISGGIAEVALGCSPLTIGLGSF